MNFPEKNLPRRKVLKGLVASTLAVLTGASLLPKTAHAQETNSRPDEESLTILQQMVKRLKEIKEMLEGENQQLAETIAAQEKIISLLNLDFKQNRIVEKTLLDIPELKITDIETHRKQLKTLGIEGPTSTEMGTNIINHVFTAKAKDGTGVKLYVPIMIEGGDVFVHTSQSAIGETTDITQTPIEIALALFENEEGIQEPRAFLVYKLQKANTFIKISSSKNPREITFNADGILPISHLPGVINEKYAQEQTEETAGTTATTVTEAETDSAPAENHQSTEPEAAETENETSPETIARGKDLYMKEGYIGLGLFDSEFYKQDRFTVRYYNDGNNKHHLDVEINFKDINQALPDPRCFALTNCYIIFSHEKIDNDTQIATYVYDVFGGTNKASNHHLVPALKEFSPETGQRQLPLSQYITKALEHFGLEEPPEQVQNIIQKSPLDFNTLSYEDIRNKANNPQDGDYEAARTVMNVLNQHLRYNVWPVRTCWSKWDHNFPGFNAGGFATVQQH